jgi:hypothetical protein
MRDFVNYLWINDRSEFFCIFWVENSMKNTFLEVPLRHKKIIFRTIPHFFSGFKNINKLILKNYEKYFLSTN